MIRRSIPVFWFFYWIFTCLIAFLAISLLCLKLLLPGLSQYRDVVESTLSNALQAEVSIAAIDGRWDGWRPVVDIDGLSIDKTGKEKTLSIAVLDTTFSFDPARSLRLLQPVFNQMDLRGLTVRHSLVSSEIEDKERLKDGEPAALSEGLSSGLLAWLLHQSSVRVFDARFELETPLGEQVDIFPVHLVLQQDNEKHQMQVKARLKTSQGEAEMHFVAEVEGHPSKNPAQFYLNIDGLDHELLNPWLNIWDIQLEKFQASQEVWGELVGGKLRYLTGKTQIDHLDYADYNFGQLALHTALIRRDRSYQLQVTDILLGEREKKLNLPRLSLDIVRNGKAYHPHQLMVDQVDLVNVKNWLTSQEFVPKTLVEILNTLQPRGELKNLLVTWPKGVELDGFNLLADLEQVSINAWDDVPEITGINGLLKADKSHGQIHLRSDDFGMFYPTLFDTRWHYNDASGIIGWRLEDEGVVVASQLLHLLGDHVSADGRFSIYLPFSKEEQPLLNLQIGMQNSDGLQAQYYIPPEEVGLDTYKWLVKAIKGGRVERAGFVLNGVTRSRLDNYQAPTVQMFFDVNQASFEYHPEWPAIYKAHSFVFFRNGELVVEAQGGKVYDSDVDYAWVHLPQSADRLFIAGDVRGKADSLQSLLKRTPLKQEVGNGLDNWQMQGELSTLLDLEIPLYTPDNLPKIQVASYIKNGRFSSKIERLDFTDIQGQIKFDSATGGLHTNNLKGRLFSQPVLARILSDNKQTQLLLNGSLETNKLKEWLDLDLLNVTRGKLSYQAQLDICADPACNQLTIKSDLRGVEIAAPTPLAKVSSQPMQLTLNSDLGDGDRGATTLTLNLGNQFRGIVLNQGQEIVKGRFTLGGGRPSLPVEQGIWVDGELASLDYDQLDQFMRQAGFVGGSSLSAKKEGKEVESNKLQEVKLQLGQFTLDDFVIDDLQVRLLPQTQGWLVKSKSEMLEGQLWLPESTDVPYALRLDRLALNKASGSADPEDYAPKTDVQPKDLPLIDIDIRDLKVADKALGHWQLEVRPTDNGAIFKNIVGQLPGTEVKGEMVWGKNGTEHTDLTLKLSSSDFSQALAAWGLSNSIETKKLDSYLQLFWDSAPWGFDISKADGVLQFDAKNGRLLDVGNSGNFLRVFGILNLNSLGRRLRLDFSDLLKSGVAFDQMKGDYRITKGIAETAEPFVMKGPSSNFIMTGQLDLVNETVDKDIEVALPVTGNIPLVSVLLGAPQVAGAVFLFDKLIGDPLEKLTKVKYHLSGDWSEPTIEIDENKKPAEKEEAGGLIENNG